MQKNLIRILTVVLFFGFVVSGVKAATNSWLTNGTDIYTENIDRAKVGIGVDKPKGRLHIKNILNDPDIDVASRLPGLLFELPSVIDANNNPGPAMQWQTENANPVSNWRQYFNSGENGWTLAGNAEWDYANKRWLPNQGGSSAYMRFDVSKGDTGQNAFEIGFAPYSDSNGPIWKQGAHYTFYDGKTGASKDDPRYPARLLIEGGTNFANKGINMDAVLSLHAGGGRTKISLVADAVEDLFKIETSRDYFDGIPGREFLVINTNTGNVGIGAKPTTHKLTVAGTAGLTTGTTWTQISDSRYKDVQSELRGSSLEKIMALRPVSYQWNSLYKDKYGQKDGLNYGFIAQDVQKVIPEFVSQDKEGYLWYNPSGFEAILTAAMQEQEEELADLKTELESIKNKLNLIP